VPKRSVGKRPRWTAPRRAAGLGLGIGLAVLLLGATAPVFGLETATDARSTLQLYTVRSRFGTPVLMRERLTHELGLELYEDFHHPEAAVPAARSGPSVVGHFRLRLDGDYGVMAKERSPNNPDHFIPGLETTPIDLSVGTLEVRDLFRRTTRISVGRHLRIDELGFMSYDGASVAFSPRQLFVLEGFAGYEQRGGLPFLSTSRYEPGGVWRGDRSEFTPELYPAYLSVRRPAPAVGGSLAVLAIPRVTLRADYRRVTERDRVVTSPFLGADGQLETLATSRISSEKAGLAVSFLPVRAVRLDGAAVTDLFRGELESHESHLELLLHRRVRGRLAHRYESPSFDGDSIFNWFGAEPSLMLEGGAVVELSRSWETYGSLGARFLGVGHAGSAASRASVAEDGLGKLGVVHRRGAQHTSLDASLEAGEAARLLLVDLATRRRLFAERWEAGLRTGVSYYRDRRLLDQAETAALYVVSATYRPAISPRLTAEWEHVLVETRAQRFRMVVGLEALW